MIANPLERRCSYGMLGTWERGFAGSDGRGASLRGWWMGFLWLVTASTSLGATWSVGPGKDFARIEDAYAAASPGDVIAVYPRENAAPYEKTALLVKKPRLTFRGMGADGQNSSHGERIGLVRVSGKGFDYSGCGSTPRAVFQFGPEADGCILEGFNISGAHNESHNGAGVRINQANGVTVRLCEIHGNDMGIMSNGDGSLWAGVDQRIENCRIFDNGDPADPGYNHNLYLGGASVRLRFCEIFGSLTGHNVKSRAHHTWVEYCYIHDSANRELDLVDAAETAVSESHALLCGNIIAKIAQCSGNRGVIHFGQDGGKGRSGTLFLYFNTVVTPFTSPVVELSTPDVQARIMGNLVSDGGSHQAGQHLISIRGDADNRCCVVAGNWLSGTFTSAPNSVVSGSENLVSWAWPLFVNPSKADYRLRHEAVPSNPSVAVSDTIAALPQFLGAEQKTQLLAWRYVSPARGDPRSDRSNPIYGAQPVAR